ncbi:endonuclease [Saccharomonospora xinjiangensis]|uniref:endonuclease I family protein n=1 Tax=Saccharomonospora xinjiangensis TaxID=75294 RepID=UPI00106FEB1E|nr:endonuclease [Saccharomonospora xinjiangensis]QBQ61302.1 Extracellular ribonuclease precursor [Saccharomonospora xinjiangensis]
MLNRTGRLIAGSLAALVVAVGAPASAEAPFDDYYSGTEGLTGEALKDALHDIIRDADQLSYGEIWDGIKATDEDPANPNNVILLYSGESRSKNDNGGDVGDWNREHVWAKSHGDFGTSGPGADLHHLRPTDVQVNSIRGNKDFDNGGSAVDGAPDNYTDGDSYEPRDEVKGDVARMIFYMAVRYEGTDSFPDLELNDQVNNGSAPYHGKLSVLLDWHEADPVDDFERNRNEVIYDSFQHNRNPFIDHPEWAAEIWG